MVQDESALQIAYTIVSYTMTSLSIVTKTYNRVAYLMECMQSVQQLVHAPHAADFTWEHVIYDDGSTDDTEAYCKSHPASHRRYIRSEQNEGVSKAAINAINHCESEWIFELDSDDIMPQRALTNWYESTIKYPQADWFIADFYRTDERLCYAMGMDYYGWKFADPRAVLAAIFRGEHFIQHNVFYKRALWRSVGMYRPELSMAEDLDLYIRFLLAGRMPVYVPWISHLHRNHLGNLSRNVDGRAHRRDLSRLAEHYSAALKKMGVLVAMER